MIGRRTFVAGGAALSLLPAGRLRAAPQMGFTHGVASGEPAAASVLVWTRYRGLVTPVPLRVELAADPGLRRIVARGTAIAAPETDWTARTTLIGLEPGRRWFYRFLGPDGSVSPTGRTATLPDGLAPRFTMAVFSCANLPFGWFNAYGDAARAPEIDLAIHLGDYLYEYARGIYPSAAETVAGRSIEPAGELVHLADYRARYASYRRDVDLLALHAHVPWLAVWDDHEFADNAWMDGAYNHDPAKQGDWHARRAAAARAWREWMPVSGDNRWRARDVGTLASLLTLETRTTGRTAEADFYPLQSPPEGRQTRLAAFRDGDWQRPDRRMLGEGQEAWLLDELPAAARRTRYQVLIQSVPMGMTVMPEVALGWVPGGGAAARDEVAMLVDAGRVGVPMNMDNWNGYPAQRGRILEAASDANARLIVLSGDSHNSWFYRLRDTKGRKAGVELSVPSVTSPGFENWFPTENPSNVAAALVGANPELCWADTVHRGYGRIVITPQAAELQWWRSAPIKSRSANAFLMFSTTAFEGHSGA
ncbi:alkaline phosphatase D family protein [uncultured Sphingomonas sp.]|uniref:alkaline phosphatase D family protein n=1 Tax=uncultured Sphingomonas sp. TaxID=158754 RepID=UPI0025D63246|nr:alkaline phosphatase D family protein [uncultured Sphingomonas sp.]